MDEHGAGALGALAWGALGLLAAAGLVAGGMWAVDYPLEATVKETRCRGTLVAGGAGSEVTVETRLLGIEHTVHDFPDRHCPALGPGTFVRYHVRTGHTIVWASEGGACLWDSRGGVAC